MYNILPSKIIAEATTFDLMVADVWTAWENHQKNPTAPQAYKQEDLEAIMAGVRNGG